MINLLYVIKYMGFWKELAAGLASDYISERGAKGALEDLGSLASGVKNFFSSDDDSGNDSTMSDYYNSLIEQEEYQEAIDFINQCYDGQTKDYSFYFYIGNAQYEMACATGDMELFNAAHQNLKTAYNSCATGTEDSSFLKSHYEKARDMWEFLKDRDEVHDNINKYLEESRYNDARRVWNQYYRKHFSGKKDFSYYYKMNDILLFELMEVNDLDRDFTAYENMLKEMESVVENDEQRSELKMNRDFLFVLKCDKKVAQHREAGAYDKAIAQIEDCYVSNPNKNDDISYWRDLFVNYFDAIRVGMQIGRDRDDDIRKLRTALAQLERLDDGSGREELENYRREMENLLSSIIKPATKESSSPTSTSSESEEEYLAELKECYADGSISDKERRLLNKLRKSLGISEERAAALEAMCNPNILSQEEEEYAEEFRVALEDGVISDKERRLLNKLAKSLNISQARAQEIESLIAKGK